MKHIPDNAEESYKCTQCGTLFSRERQRMKNCPVCGFT